MSASGPQTRRKARPARESAVIMLAVFKNYILQVLRTFRSPHFAGVSINPRWRGFALAGKPDLAWLDALPPGAGRTSSCWPTGGRRVLRSTRARRSPAALRSVFRIGWLVPPRWTRWVFRVAHRSVGVPERCTDAKQIMDSTIMPL